MEKISDQVEKIEKEIKKISYRMNMWEGMLIANKEYIEDLISKLSQAQRQQKRYEKGYTILHNQVQDKVRQMKEIVLNYNPK